MEADPTAIKMTTAAAEMRGIILNQVIAFENVLDRVIAIRYCKTEEEISDFIRDVVFFVSLRNKKIIVMNYIKKVQPDINLNNLNKTFDKIIRIRNVLAHQLIDVTPQQVKKYD